jgi:hypothetical protein
VVTRDEDEDAPVKKRPTYRRRDPDRRGHHEQGVGGTTRNGIEDDAE